MKSAKTSWCDRCSRIVPFDGAVSKCNSEATKAYHASGNEGGTRKRLARAREALCAYWRQSNAPQSRYWTRAGKGSTESLRNLEGAGRLHHLFFRVGRTMKFDDLCRTESVHAREFLPQ